MTELAEGDEARCAYCRRPLARRPGAGRPARYCRRSHRQRAYEARRRAAQASLPTGQLVVDQHVMDRLHDRLYVLEAALDDVTADLADLDGRSGRTTDRSRAAAYAAALEHLRQAAGDLRGFVVEPATG